MKPMLACDAPDTLTLHNYMVSVKYDGVRVAIREGKVLTRALKELPNDYIRKELQGLPDGLDMEIVTFTDGLPDSFQVVSGKVRRKSGSPNFIAYIFDTCGRSGCFYERYLYMQSLSFASHITVVEQNLMFPKEIDAYYEQALKDGHEGIMVRATYALYKHGRSTQREQGLMRRKPTLTAEATCVKVIEALENLNPQKVTELGNLRRSSHKEGMEPKGTLGALEVTHPTFGTFRLSGFTDSTAAELWANPPIGLPVEFEYKSLTDGNKPRHPIFKGIRYDLI